MRISDWSSDVCSSDLTVAVADAVKAVADEIGATSAQVALAWVLANPAVASPLVGARTLRQLEDNIGALNVVLSEADKARLDDVSRVEPGFPHDFLSYDRSEEHTSELQSLMRISYAVFCLTKKKNKATKINYTKH